VSGFGGFNHRLPTGGCAKGIPLNVSNLPVEDPITVAAGEGIATVGAAARFSIGTGGAAKATGRTVRSARKRFMIIVVGVWNP
jgi:hypothetical protein